MLFFSDHYLSHTTAPLSTEPHIPNISTPEGLRAVLSLCNFTELANILNKKTYYDGIPLRERLQLVAGRQASRRLVAWMDTFFRTATNDVGDEISIFDIHLQWLASQTASLWRHSQAVATESKEAFIVEHDDGSAIDHLKLSIADFAAQTPHFQSLFNKATGESYDYPGKLFTVVPNVSSVNSESFERVWYICSNAFASSSPRTSPTYAFHFSLVFSVLTQN